MTLHAIALDAECLLAVMAGTAFLAFLHGSHGELRLLHREDLRMAVVALETLVGVDLAVKRHVAHRGLEYHGLSRRDRKRAPRDEHHGDYEGRKYCRYLQSLHLLS